jgi:hypothetical protein
MHNMVFYIEIYWNVLFIARYCICQKEWVDNEEEKAEYIGCDNQDCTKHSWYHISCLRNNQKVSGNVFNKPPSKGKAAWFCSSSCIQAVEDGKLAYSKGIVFAGLNQESFKMAIRANDGIRMQIYHKMHLVQLFNKGHKMYFRIYHRILALMANGPPHIRHDLLHNSTVNCRGYKGGNLPLDFVNELLIKSLKGESYTSHCQRQMYCKIRSGESTFPCILCR